MWRVISTAPFGRDLELCVIDHDEAHALVFPCRRSGQGWISTVTNQLVDVNPTHWREWVGK
jgi:hypothetical protein